LHKNTDNQHDALSAEVTSSVVNFIHQKGLEKGEVYATGIIRSLTGHELRDEEKGAVDLPSSTSRREMYEKHCFSRGWAPTSDNMGRYPRLCDYLRRKTDDIFCEDDVETSDVCSWWSFRQIWKEHYPHIRIRRPCNDTCGECTVYRNAFRYRESRKKAEVESDSDDSGSDDDEDQNKQGFKDDEILGDLENSFLSGDCLEQERISRMLGITPRKRRECVATSSRKSQQVLSAVHQRCHTKTGDMSSFVTTRRTCPCHIMAERNLVKFITSRILQSTSLGLLT
jgi:hypothetical protein